MATEQLTKQVGFAYPSSTIAEKYKTPEGCWTVHVSNNNTPLEVFETEREAVDYAYDIDLPWSWVWLHVKRNYTN